MRAKPGLEGFIVNFRRGPKTQKNDELIVEIPGVDSKARASLLIGRKVVLEVEGKKLIGSIISTHGSRGRVRVRLRRGLPGQWLATKVKIV